MAFVAIFALNFHSGVCTTFCFKSYSPCKTWKRLIGNASFFTFFTTLDLIWPKFCPKITPIFFFFFAVFQWNMLGDSIGIKNFNWNPVVLKKICQTIFQPNLHQKGLTLSHSQNQNLFFFFSQTTKPDHKLSKTFYFMKISNVLIELWMFFYCVLCFFVKKGHFQP